MAKTTEEIIEELRKFSTSELCDGVGAGKYQTMDYQIQERVTYKKIVGPAYTVKPPIGISGLIPDGILEMKKGDVMVIAGKGYCNGSYWGDHRSICAAMKEAEAVMAGARKKREAEERTIRRMKETGEILPRVIMDHQPAKEEK